MGGAGFGEARLGNLMTRSGDMTEFLVLRGYRRRGIGTEVGHEVWRQFPGRWELRVMQSNHAAYLFWERAITGFAGEATV